MSADIQIFNPESRFSPEQEELLKAPLDANRIKYRPGAGGMQLKYIKGDDAIGVANDVFGFGRWGYKVINRGHEIVEDRKNGPTDVYTADIELYVVGAAFPFPGDGVGIVSKPYTVEMHEKARKEATTDAIKRALRHYGDCFGLCLYNEDDYVDAGDGTLVQVKEVKPGRSAQQPKRVVESSNAPRQAPPQSEEDRRRLRLNEIFKAGKAKGLYGNKDEMAEYISDGLKMPVSAPDIANLGDDLLLSIEQAIASAQGLAQAS